MSKQRPRPRKTRAIYRATAIISVVIGKPTKSRFTKSQPLSWLSKMINTAMPDCWQRGTLIGLRQVPI